MKQVTVTVFLSETHVEVFDGDNYHREEAVHPDSLTYGDALATVPKVVSSIGGKVRSIYFEENEFGDPITCFFVEV